MDLHNKPFSERLEILNSIRFPSVEAGPKIRVIEHRLASNMEELKKLVKEDAFRPGSEGVVVKPSDGTYDLDGVPTKAGWLKWHKNSSFRVVVLKVNPTATEGVQNYTYGILAGDAKPAEPFELNGKTYMVIGKSFSTAQKFNVGDEIEIESESVNYTQNDDGTIELSFWVPTVLQPEDAKFSSGQPRDSWGRWSSWGGELPNIEPGTDILSYSESFQGKEFPRQIMANTGSLDVALISDPKDIVAKLKDNEFDAQKFKANGAYELNMVLQDADDPQNVKAIWNGGNRIQEAWKQTSNDSGGAQDLLQVEAARRLPAGTDHATTHGMELAQKWNSSHPGNEKISASVYDNIQGRTQEHFASKGFKPDDEITVFRGIDGDIGDELSLRVNPGDPADILSSRPLSSWSLDPVTARMFSDDSGVVIAAKVRVGDVFSHFSTGFGCMDENEVILPAGSAKNAVFVYSKGPGGKGLKAKTKIALDDEDANADWIQTLEKKRLAGELYPLKGKDWRV